MGLQATGKAAVIARQNSYSSQSISLNPQNHMLTGNGASKNQRPKAACTEGSHSSFEELDVSKNKENRQRIMKKDMYSPREISSCL